MRFTTGSRNVTNVSAEDEEVETEVRKWLRIQPKKFYSAGFDVLVQRWDKFISVGGGYVEK
jgi:hypothetical protein